MSIYIHATEPLLSRQIGKYIRMGVICYLSHVYQPESLQLMLISLFQRPNPTFAGRCSKRPRQFFSYMDVHAFLCLRLFTNIRVTFSLAILWPSVLLCRCIFFDLSIMFRLCHELVVLFRRVHHRETALRIDKGKKNLQHV